jgi:hypothetical protein
MISLLACCVGATIWFGAVHPARATSPVVQPPLDLGQTSFLDGEAGPGGLFELIGNGYVASHFTTASGRRAPGTNQ